MTVVLFFLLSIVGASKIKKYRKLILEQAKTTGLELVPEEPSEPVPPLIVDHERLKVCLAFHSLLSMTGIILGIYKAVIKLVLVILTLT